jgi:Zn-dependent membrane protease YugP
MFPLFFDPTMVILIPAIILSMYAQAKVKGTYAKYSRVAAQSGMTGAQVASNLLRQQGIQDVQVELTPGSLSDHYDPRSKKLRLSPEVYHGNSLASLGIAAHETGHAVQHNIGYFPLEFRNLIAPVAQIGSTLAFPILFIGLIFQMFNLAMLGVYVFLGVVIFQLVTLPVEFNASSRAITMLASGNYLTSKEIGPTKSVLSAAALTYVAAAVTAILTLVRLLVLSGFFRRDE